MKCSNRVLIVEDDRDIRESVSQLLELEGYHVATAQNGKEALAILEASEPPCVIVLDMMMPVMDGWQFLEVRAQRQKLSRIPVVVATAGRDNPAPGLAVDTMRKPVDIDALLRVIEQHCMVARQSADWTMSEAA